MIINFPEKISSCWSHIVSLSKKIKSSYKLKYLWDNKILKKINFTICKKTN